MTSSNVLSENLPDEIRTHLIRAADDDLATLRRGLLDLEDLVQNWKERTTNCNYAEVNRDLLGSQNKAALLKQASENAAVAKGSAVKTLCKRDPEAVRRILGLDGKLNAKSAPLLAPGAARQERLTVPESHIEETTRSPTS